MKNIFHSFLASALTGYLFFYFSELVFWAHPRLEDNLVNWLQTWMAYSLMAFLFLVVVKYFKVNDLASIFLAGAFFGWLAEGVIVHTLIEDLPLSISFTGLAWHALITVVFGWFALHSALQRSLRSTITMAIYMGFFVWFWGISAIYERPTEAVSPPVFAAYTFVSTLLLILSLIPSRKVFSIPFNPPRWLVYVIGSFFVVLYILALVMTRDVNLLLLISLMAILFFALRRHLARTEAGDVIELLARPVPLGRYFILLLSPVIASILYFIYWNSRLMLPTNWVVYLITTPAGFILLGWSLWKIWRKTSKKVPPALG